MDLHGPDTASGLIRGWSHIALSNRSGTPLSSYPPWCRRTVYLPTICWCDALVNLVSQEGSLGFLDPRHAGGPLSFCSLTPTYFGRICHRKVSSRLAAFLLYFAFVFSLVLRAAPPLWARKRRTMSPSDMGGWVVVLAFFFGRFRFWCQPSQYSRLNKQRSAGAHPEWHLLRRQACRVGFRRRPRAAGVATLLVVVAG